MTQAFIFFMEHNFIINAFLLGIGLAMDAFSISLANGLNKPKMNFKDVLLMVFVFGLFQALMPLIGWHLTSQLAEKFEIINKIVPYLALILLLYIGIKMIVEKDKKEEKVSLNFSVLVIQAIATSIDALSVGLTMIAYSFSKALYEALIIGIVTFILCLIAYYIGKKGGNKLSNNAPIIGGIILIIVGIKIFISGVI